MRVKAPTLFQLFSVYGSTDLEPEEVTSPFFSHLTTHYNESRISIDTSLY